MSIVEIMDHVQKLSGNDQLQLLEKLTLLIQKKQENQQHSILELEGLGESIWKNIDVEEYIQQERASWNG